MNTHRALVVEDDPDLAATMQEALQDEDYEVRVVLHGVRAYAEAAAFLPHVILLDLMMPDFDGYDIGRQLRGDDVTAAIPVVIVSGYKQLEDAEILLKTHYSLFKPFDISDLLGCVEAAIARRPYP